MYLPNELLEEILEYLVADPRSLAPCARAAKRLYPIAQSRFFRTLSLYFGEPDAYFVGRETLIHGTPDRLLALLDAAPHLAALVLRLHLFQCVPEIDAAQAAALGAAVPRLTHLTALAFPPLVDAFAHFRVYHAIWRGLFRVQGNLPLVGDALRRAALVELDVVNVNLFAVRALRGRRRLRRLALGQIDSGMLSARNGGELEVEELALHQCTKGGFGDVVRWLASTECCVRRDSVRHLDVRFLVPMELRVKDDGLDSLFQLFPDVEELYLTPNQNVATAYDEEEFGAPVAALPGRYAPPRLAHLRSLRALTLRFELYTDFIAFRLGGGFSFGSSLEWVAALLRSAGPLDPESESASASRIRALTLVLELKPLALVPQRYKYQTHFARLPAWAALVDALVGGSFPALRVVELEIAVPNFVKRDERTAIRETLRRAEVFGRLRESGIALMV